MSGSKSTTLSDKVEASLEDVMLNFKLLKKEMGAEFTRKYAQLESEKQLLEAAKDKLKAAKLELEADRAEFEAIRYSPDPKLESEKAALKSEKMQLKAEKIKLKTAQDQLGKDRAVLKNRQFKLKSAQSQLDDAKTQLESAQSQLDGTKAQLEIAQAHLEEDVLNSKKHADAKASLEVAKRRFTAATRQLNAAMSRFESSKILLDAALAEDESGHVSDDKVAELERKVLQLEYEKSKGLTQISLLEDDKLGLKGELSQSKAEVKRLFEKVKEVEKQLGKCRVENNKKPQTVIPGFKKNPRVFLDVAINGRAARRIVIELDVKTTPKTCENFRALCTGEEGLGRSGKPLHYKGSKFNYRHRDGSYCTGGDTIDENGIYGESIYGLTFKAENFIKKHIGPGVVTMASQTVGGQYVSRGSQFAITARKCEFLDNNCVAFGDVVEGMDVVTEIMNAGARASVIADCGQLS